MDETKKKDFEEKVRAGGVYYVCLACKGEGVISADDEIAKGARKKAGIKKPNLMGIKVYGCENCRKQADEGS